LSAFRAGGSPVKQPLVACVLVLAAGGAAPPAEAGPDRLVGLTLDDAPQAPHALLRPPPQKDPLGGPFLPTHGLDFPTNKKDYMTWQEIAELHRDGFEIGNHTRDHQPVTARTLRDLPAQVRGINERCKQHGIPAPVSFAYPGNAIDKAALPVLKDLGI